MQSPSALIVPRGIFLGNYKIQFKKAIFQCIFKITLCHKIMAISYNMSKETGHYNIAMYFYCKKICISR